MINKVKNTIIDNNMVESGDSIIVGVSGGPDSVCLLHVLKSLAEGLGVAELTCVHVNHMLRGGDADNDQKYVEGICADMGIKCISRSVDIKLLAEEKGVSEEAVGRNARYEIFEEACRLTGAAKIAVAHNMNDQAETVMMRIIRGTGPSGMGGMEYARSAAEDGGLTVIRPLLDVARAEIEQYCSVNRLGPHTDMSNMETKYTRNKIRLELLPYLEANFNENITGTLIRMAQIAREDEDYIDTIVKGFIDENWDDGTLPVRVVKSLHPTIKKRVIIAAFKKAGLDKNISSVHVEAAVRVIDSGRGNKEVEFPLLYSMKVSQGRLCFMKKVVKS